MPHSQLWEPTKAEWLRGSMFNCPLPRPHPWPRLAHPTEGVELRRSDLATELPWSGFLALWKNLLFKDKSFQLLDSENGRDLLSNAWEGGFLHCSYFGLSRSPASFRMKTLGCTRQQLLLLTARSHGHAIVNRTSFPVAI